MNYQFRSLVSA